MQNAFDGQAQATGSISSRPTIRRKSSAGLLSSFKAPSSTGNTAPVQQAPNVPMQLPSTPSVANTPIPAPPPVGRDWDSQSMYSESAGSSVTTNTTNSALPTVQGTSMEYLRDLVQKRIVILAYLRNAHEGKIHWFQTILITRADLDRVFNNTAMRKRTYKFAILAMSLSALYDIPTAQDFLRGVLTTLIEFDQFQDENIKPKRFFRLSKPPKRQTGGVNDFPFPDTSETSYVMSPHIPFPLDYHQTLLSLLDILSELYQKIARILGPSPFQMNIVSSFAMGMLGASVSSTTHMMSPLGLISPHLGVSGVDAVAESADTNLWSIVGGITPSNGSLGSPTLASWTSGMGDMFLKIDGKLKKVMSTLLKELDQFARNEIKDELATLDPLLRNVAVTDAAREQYDFEVAM